MKASSLKADASLTVKLIKEIINNMKIKRLKIPSLIAAMTILISACGAPAAPTMSAADVQLTAVAAAFTVVAQTQAAIPTATLLPPTETASPTQPPTNTAVSLPTLETDRKSVV